MVHLITKRYGLVLAGLLIFALVLVAPVAADTHYIYPGTGTIQAEVTAASTGDIIILTDGTYNENNIIITGKSLTFRADTANSHGPLDTIIDGSATENRIFTVTDGSSITLESLTLRNGHAPAGADTHYEPGGNGANGGAIWSGGTVTILSSIITGCTAGSGGSATNDRGGNGGSGGAVYTSGSVVMTSSGIANCYAGNGGSGKGDAYPGGSGGSAGAIAAGGTVTLTSTSISDCAAGNGGSGENSGTSGNGGAIWSAGAVTITSGSIGGCRAGYGGTAYFSDGKAGGSGGAVWSSGPVTILDSSFSDCGAGGGGSAGSGSEGGNGGDGGSGGAVYTTSTVAMTSSSVTSCYAGYPGNHGGEPGSVSGIMGTGSAVYATTNGGTLNFDRIYGNNNGQVVYASGMNAENTWWGSNAGPGATVAGADTSPWLMLGISASPATVSSPAYWSTITANLTYNSDHQPVSASGHIWDGTPVSFSTGAGSVVPGTATTFAGGASTHFTPSGGGAATVTATVDDQSVPVALFIIEPVVAAFSGSPVTGSAPLTVSFTDESTGSPDQWTWNFGSYNAADGGISSGKNPTHTYDAAGDYTVTLMAKTSFSSDSASGVRYITVLPPGIDPITADFMGDAPLTGDVPLTVQFHDTSSGLPKIWIWSFGDGGVSSDQNPSHTYNLPGAYTVTLTAMNESVSDTVSRPGYVTVTSVDMPVVANFANATPRNGTVPLTVQFTDTSGGLPDLWTWSFGDGAVSSDQNPSHTYNRIGSYTVSLTATNTTIPSSNTLTQLGFVNVKPVPATPGPTREPSTGSSGAGYTGSGGSDSGTGPAPVKKGDITFFVDSAYLSEHGVLPANIVMMSYSGGGWTSLPTRFTGSSCNRFYFTADSDKYSLVAIGNTRDGITGMPVIGSTTSPAPTVRTVPVTSIPPAAAEARIVARETPPVPVVQQTTTAPPVPATPVPGFPFMIIALIGAGCVVLIGSGWYVRRWWVRRQNPALFREYD